jgi:uncharacterized protein YjfI (DUF2170 family)
MREEYRVLAELYAESEKIKTEIKERQDVVKEKKDAMIALMNELGQDHVLISGLDQETVELEIAYPVREVLNKKDLAQHLAIKPKELNDMRVWTELVREGRIHGELLTRFIIEEERVQFSARPYREEG